MKTGIVGAAFLLGILAAAACSEDGANSDPRQLTKDEARGMGKADWSEDYCTEFGWYGDGVCDSFCPSPDPDCLEEATCGPIPGGECGAGEVCDLRTCGVGGTGTCVPQPDACIQIYDPVCGCDGATYANDCERLAAGTPLAYEGPCGF